MKRLNTIFALLLVCSTAFCQQLTVQKLSEQLASSCVSFNYKYRAADKSTKEVSGDVKVQGQCYRIKANGVLLISDSKTRWTVDSDSKEVYIERGSRLPAILSNPKQLSKSLTGVTSTADGLSGVFANPDDGIKYSFSISSFAAQTAEKDKSPYTFDVTGLDASWVVTDLR